jgi:hypothetical protein
LLGTSGARQLRDGTDTAVVDRTLAQARFSAIEEGRAWWKKNKYDAAALFRAALSHDEGGLDDQDLSGRLMRLAVDQRITDGAGSDRPISMWKSRCSQLVTATANPA